MPVIKLSISELNEMKRKKLIASLTKTASEVTGIPEKSFIVLLDEYPAQNIGVGGIDLVEFRKDQDRG